MNKFSPVPLKKFERHLRGAILTPSKRAPEHRESCTLQPVTTGHIHGAMRKETVAPSTTRPPTSNGSNLTIKAIT